MRFVSALEITHKNTNWASGYKNVDKNFNSTLAVIEDWLPSWEIGYRHWV